MCPPTWISQGTGWAVNFFAALGGRGGGKLSRSWKGSFQGVQHTYNAGNPLKIKGEHAGPRFAEDVSRMDRVDSLDRSLIKIVGKGGEELRENNDIKLRTKIAEQPNETEFSNSQLERMTT
ncbi:hypothetical protein B0H16DRAFT_1472380 [Mycena metata]|uniref:Uncharacterized protein n=1 Tax=Mycena metata TaxID=1033252 RepID=A0AAD7HNC9_9AGAR|nr:hypothetical protein B0H16DRAFT_1472380 [Mycena metata]